MKKVSVIVPAFNAEKTIKRAISSIMQQTYKNIEIIIIDDGSSDNTGLIVKSFKTNTIKYIYQSNGGVSSARNRGIDNATGFYVCFVDSDDAISKDYIERLAKGIKNCDLCAYSYDKSVNTCEINQNNRQEILFSKIRGYACNKLFKTSILKKKNIRFKHDIHMCEDLLFTYTFLCNANKISLIDHNGYYYQKDGASITNLNNGPTEKWYTVLLAYEKILNMALAVKDNNLHFLKYNYIMYILEANYYDKDHLYIEQISKSKKEISKIRTPLKLKERINITLFCIMPAIIARKRS